MNLKELCTELKLSHLKENADILIREAEQTKMPYSEFLLELLENEHLRRIENGIKRRQREAAFPEQVSIENVETDCYDSKFANKFNELNSLDFITKKENIIFIGASGAGKTHCALALGNLACTKGFNVLFVSVPDLIIRLKEAMSQNQITTLKSKFRRYHLIIVDELGYFSFDKSTAELFLNLLSDRFAKGSVIITSNLNFDEWAVPLGDTRLTAALVDRLCCRSHIIELEREIGGRMQETKRWLASKNKAK